MKPDIQTRQHIEQLVDSFYTKVKDDDTIGHIFNEVAKVDWSHHLPKMYDFFETVILGQKGFKGNPMETHFTLNKKFPLQNEHFSRWKDLFFATIDELFEGETAQEAKQKATSIADLMLFKITSSANGVNINPHPKTRKDPPT
jgi:hemoglobin